MEREWSNWDLCLPNPVHHLKPSTKYTNLRKLMMLLRSRLRSGGLGWDFLRRKKESICYSRGCRGNRWYWLNRSAIHGLTEGSCEGRIALLLNLDSVINGTAQLGSLYASHVTVGWGGTPKILVTIMPPKHQWRSQIELMLFKGIMCWTQAIGGCSQSWDKQCNSLRML